MGEACSTDRVQERSTQSFGGGGAEGRRRLGRPGRRMEDNIKMNPQEVEWGGGVMDSIAPAQDRDSLRALVNAVMSHPVS